MTEEKLLNGGKMLATLWRSILAEIETDKTVQVFFESEFNWNSIISKSWEGDAEVDKI